jgi:hypothetical protein
LAIAVEVDTPGIVFDALQAAAGETTDKPATEAATKAPTEEPTPQPSKSDAANPWSLPLTGTVAVRANFLEYQHYRAEGLRALLTLEHEDAKLHLSEGSLCGIALPLTLHATPKTFEASVSLSVKNRSLGDTAQCLQSEQVSINGNFDLSATLSAHGELATIADSLTKSLSGSIELHAREGEIHQLKLLGNILSLKAVGDILQGDVKLGANGFKYRTIAVVSAVKDGTVTVEQASLDSPALGLAATGTIRLTDYDSRLTVLVAPFGRLDSVMRKVPIVGYVMGGALTSIPVGVSGDIRDPRVVPLGPGAVSSEVMGIFERTFKLPGKMVEPLTKPKEPAKPKEPSEPKEK